MDKKTLSALGFFLVLFLVSASAKQVFSFFPGGNFDERAQNYINDNGAFWVNKYSNLEPPYYQHQTIWAWLENNSNPQGVHQTIGWFLEDIGGGPHDDPSWPWQVYWAKHSHLSTVTAFRVLLQYGDLIKSYDQQYGWDDYQGLKKDLT